MRVFGVYEKTDGLAREGGNKKCMVGRKNSFIKIEIIKKKLKIVVSEWWGQEGIRSSCWEERIVLQR